MNAESKSLECIWNEDHAASGLRYRAFLSEGEVVVYASPAKHNTRLDWFVYVPNGGGANGFASTVEEGKERALRAYEVMTAPLSRKA